MIWILFSLEFGVVDRSFQKVWFTKPTYKDVLWWTHGRFGWEEEHHIEHLNGLVEGKTIKVDDGTLYWIQCFQDAPKKFVLVDSKYQSDQVKNTYLVDMRKKFQAKFDSHEKELKTALDKENDLMIYHHIEVCDAISKKLEIIDAEIAYREQEGWGLTTNRGRR